MHVDSSQRTWTNPHVNPLIDDSGGGDGGNNDGDGGINDDGDDDSGDDGNNDGDSGGGDDDGDDDDNDSDVEAKRSRGLSEGDAGDSHSTEEGDTGGGEADSPGSAAPVGSGQVSALLIAAVAVCYLALCVLALWKPSMDSSLNSSCPLPLLLQHRGEEGSCNWTFVGRRDEIDSFVTRIVGSPVSANRGVAVVNRHVAVVVGTYLDMDSPSTWIDSMSVVVVEQQSTSSASTAAVDPVPVPQRLQGKHDDPMKANKTTKASNNNSRRSVADKLSSFMRRVFNSGMQRKVSEHSTLVPAEAAAASTRQLVYQHYDQLWPLPDRDLLLLQEITLYHTHKKVTADSYAAANDDDDDGDGDGDNDCLHPSFQVVVSYRSTQDSRYPPTRAAVRGEALLVKWMFQDRDQYCKEMKEKYPATCSEWSDPSSPGGAVASRTRSTVVSVERAVDLKGAIPGWVADFFDRYVQQ